MNHHLYFAGAGMALLAPLLASCEQKGPSKILQAEIVSALENVEDKASADEAAQLINEAYEAHRIKVETARIEHDADQDEADRHFIGDHLRRGAQRGKEGIFRVR